MGREGFIGIGTGRCGTVSLVEIVAACSRTSVTHERYLADWYKLDPPEDPIRNLIANIEAHRGRDVLCGEVQAHVLPHLPFIRRHLPDTKVVCMHRAKQEVVNSFLSWAPGYTTLRPADKIFLMNNPKPGPKTYANKFPIIDAATPEQAWGFWWEFYELMVQSIADPIFHMNVNDLNDDSRVGQLFDFLEIPPKDRVFIEERKHNSLAAAVSYAETVAGGG